MAESDPAEERRLFVELFEQYVRPGANHDAHSLDVMLRLAMSVLAVCRERVGKMLLLNRERPVLYTYANDGWGADVSERTAITDGQHLVVRHGCAVRIPPQLQTLQSHEPQTP